VDWCGLGLLRRRGDDDDAVAAGALLLPLTQSRITPFVGLPRENAGTTTTPSATGDPCVSVMASSCNSYFRYSTTKAFVETLYLYSVRGTPTHVVCRVVNSNIASEVIFSSLTKVINHKNLSNRDLDVG
jgi:hypothetical protein